MAHFAKLDDNNIVLEVNVVSNDDVNNLPFPESEPVGIDFLNTWAGQVFNWKQTSYNASFRKNYAGVGFTYDLVKDAFIPPQPYPSWLLDENTCQWYPPVPLPPFDSENPVFYQWDESTLSWVAVNV